MTSALHGVAAQVRGSLGDLVHEPGSPGYEDSLSRVFFPDAARRRPPCVVHPRSADDVADTLRAAAGVGARVTVRGGGLSSNCVADDAIMIDLSVHLNRATTDADGERVTLGGGGTVGAALAALAPTGCVIPVGIVGLAGIGLVTRGGVGYLTRSVGLTLDHLVEVELALPTGDVVRLSEASVGAEAELWWAVRGAAPAFGVVTSVVLRTQPQGPVFVDRLVVELDALPAYFAVAPELPRDTTMGAVLSPPTGSDAEPVLFVYTACRSQDETAIGRARAATSAVAAGSRSAARYRSETRGRYLDGLPQFATPGVNGEEPLPITVPEPDADRGWFYGKSVFTGPTLGADVAAGLADCIRQAPTPACRIDFQHTGGALADGADAAFWGRGGEWNIPLNAIWAAAEDGPACYEWARRTLGVLAKDTIGVYSVEVRPGFEETERELELAYGDNLIRLRSLRSTVDPAGVLADHPL